MKTKNKVLAMVEIAVVLCSLFLVALPAIAADQSAQEVSANVISTASEDDYVLGVYGNANEDDTIDMRDLTYVKLIFFGKKPETELADAKYDGKINPLDFIQIKLIIVGKEKELTIVDTADRIVTVKKPIKRIISGYRGYDAEVMRAFRAQDKIVGVCGGIIKKEIYFPELSKLTLVGGGYNPDIETILSLNPDLVIFSPKESKKIAGWAEKLPGIPVVGLAFYTPADMNEEVMILGYCLNKKAEAKYLIANFLDKYINLIKTRTEGLSEEKKPKVYVERTKPYSTYGSRSYVQQGIDIAGGKNIFADVEASQFVADPEEVMTRNPDIIIKYVSETSNPEAIGYGIDDPSKVKEIRDEIMNRPELANVNAVKNGRVYIIEMSMNLGPKHPLAKVYWAKWIHPELFEDLNPKPVHQEWLTEFQGLDYDLDKHGVFAYPEEPV